MICVQIYDDPGRETRVKASQCFTKYKWRELGPAELDSGPAIVATQVRGTSHWLSRLGMKGTWSLILRV